MNKRTQKLCQITTKEPTKGENKYPEQIMDRSKSVSTRRTGDPSKSARTHSSKTNKTLNKPLPIWVPNHLRKEFSIHFLDENTVNSNNISPLCSFKNNSFFSWRPKERKRGKTLLPQPKNTPTLQRYCSQVQSTPFGACKVQDSESSEFSECSMSSLSESDEPTISVEELKAQASELTKFILSQVRNEIRPGNEFNLKEKVFMILSLGEELTYCDIKRIFGENYCEDDGKYACFTILCENVKIY